MERRDQIERTADRLREEWMQTLRELDRRRVETLSVDGMKAMLQRHPLVLGLSALGLAGAITGGIVLARARKHHRDHEVNRIRLRALTRAWRFPERVATRAPDQPGGQLVARKVLMASLTTLGVQLGTRLVKRALPAG